MKYCLAHTVRQKYHEMLSDNNIVAQYNSQYGQLTFVKEHIFPILNGSTLSDMIDIWRIIPSDVKGRMTHRTPIELPYTTALVCTNHFTQLLDSPNLQEHNTET